MAKASAGWRCVANPNWLDFLAQLPNPVEAVYYKGPFRPTTKLAKGSLFICCRNGESPRRVHLVARFDGYKVLSLAEAWRTYELKLGVPDESRWLALNPGNDGRVSCHLLSDVRFLEEPVPLDSTRVVLTNAASNMGRYLDVDEVERICSKLLFPITGSDHDSRSSAGDAEVFSEGRERLRLHRRKERNKRAVERKKQQVLSATGGLVCEVCNFDFAKVYGPLGQGFAECHHRVPMSELHEEYRLRLRDLAIVCANCHRMLHRRPWRTVLQLREIVQQYRAMVAEPNQSLHRTAGA